MNKTGKSLKDKLFRDKWSAGRPLVLGVCLLLMLLGGGLYYYENNPQVYNTLAEAGVDMDILDALGRWEGELAGGAYYRLVDEAGETIDQTGHEVYVGDEVILENNNRYKVISVDEKQGLAACQLLGQEEIAWQEEWGRIPVMSAAESSGKVAVYMTHTDESYIPTDGTESKPGKGGILEVGERLADTLKNSGVNADLSLNKHDPHDANAYHRSRKTAVQLLKKNPTALIDVHRDGVPDPGFYKTEVEGKPGTKIRLVVGRQNPHMAANLEFAKNIKAYFDKHNPGLIKGIFMAKGNYNQDLSPRSILIEVGTHTNSRKEAENGVEVFAAGIPSLMGIGTTGEGKAPSVPGTAGKTGAGSSLIWLLAVLVVGGGAFLLISTGSVRGSVQKLGRVGRELIPVTLKTRRKK